MHSPNFKIVSDLKTTTRRCYCVAGWERLGSMERKMWGGTKSVGWGWKDFTGRSRIVACASASENNGGRGNPDSGSGPELLSRRQTYSLMKQQMEIAAKAENYKEAARLRDSLKSFEEEDPVMRLKGLLMEAIHEERFEDAARYRDELKEIASHYLLKCTSDATTLGVRVQVKSVYIEGRSRPTKGQYFFAYRIRITNNSDRPVQLLRRHWVITDASGKTEHVRGVGVIGEQPVILPNSAFEYSSACPLTTPSGRMEGEFEMKHTDKIGAPSFNAVIAPFCLSSTGDGSDVF